MNSLVLELAGLPGVGKSAVVAEVAEILEQRGLRVTRDPPSPVAAAPQSSPHNYLGFLAARPVFVAVSCSAILRTRQPSKRDLIWTTSTWLKRCARLSQALRGPGVSLFDPGIAQALWSIGLRARTDSFSQLASFLLQRAPLPDFVAVVDAGDSTVISRLAGRPGSSSRLERQELTPEALRAARGRMEEVVRAIERLSGDRPRILHTFNDRQHTPSACARDVIDRVAQSCDLSFFEDCD